MNLQPQPPEINTWLLDASQQLQGAGIPSARLDAEIILAHTLRKSRTYLHAHGDEQLAHHQHEIANARLQLRITRTPIAYIIGHKEFYGRLFKVTSATLIPRPESEDVINILKEIAQPNTEATLVDVGTGTGCLGITAKLELPDLDVTLVDISNHALNVAKTNAGYLGADVTVLHGDLLSDYSDVQINYIIANLPYVDPEWARSPETNYEPKVALFASENGLSLIISLIRQATSCLAAFGYLILEADPRQHQYIIEHAKQHSLQHHSTAGFIVCLQKV